MSISVVLYGYVFVNWVFWIARNIYHSRKVRTTILPLIKWLAYDSRKAEHNAVQMIWVIQT